MGLLWSRGAGTGVVWDTRCMGLVWEEAAAPQAGGSAVPQPQGRGCTGKAAICPGWWNFYPSIFYPRCAPSSQPREGR